MDRDGYELTQMCPFLRAASGAFYRFGREGDVENETVDGLSRGGCCSFVCLFFGEHRVIDFQVKQRGGVWKPA